MLSKLNKTQEKYLSMCLPFECGLNPANLLKTELQHSGFSRSYLELSQQVYRQAEMKPLR